MEDIRSYRDLRVWQGGMDLAAEAYPSDQIMAKIRGLRADKSAAACGRFGACEYRQHPCLDQALGKQLNALIAKLSIDR